LKLLLGIVVALIFYGKVLEFLKPPDKVEEFWVENYDIVAEPEGIELYFTREISTDEEIALNLHLDLSNETFLNTLVKIGDTKNRKYLFKTNEYPELKPFIHQHLNDSSTITSISCYIDQFSSSPYIYLDAGGVFRINNNKGRHINIIEQYTPNHQEKRMYNRSWSPQTTGSWRPSLFRDAYGKFDTLNRKQGYWEWRYSNGNTLAKTEFFDNKITELLTTYTFHGKIIDSVFYNDQGERIRWKQFKPNGAVVFENEYEQKSKKSQAK